MGETVRQIASIAIGYTVGFFVGPTAGRIAGLATYVLLSPARDDEDQDSDATLVDDSGLQVETFNSTSPCKIIYGTRKVGGHINFHATTSATSSPIDGTYYPKQNQFYHRTIIWSLNEITAVEKLYLNEKELTVDQNGVVTNDEFTLERGNGWDNLTLAVAGSADLTDELDTVETNTLILKAPDTRFAWGNGVKYLDLAENTVLYEAGDVIWFPKPNTYQHPTHPRPYIRYENEGWGPTKEVTDPDLVDNAVKYTVQEDVIVDSDGKATIVLDRNINLVKDLGAVAKFGSVPISTFLPITQMRFAQSDQEMTVRHLTLIMPQPQTIKSIPHLRIKNYLGSPDQEADPDLVNDVENWTADHRGRGLAYSYIRLKFNRDIFTSIPQFSALIKGRKVYDPRNESTAFSNNPALVLRDYLTLERINGGVGIPESSIDDTFVIAAANVCDEEVTKLDDSTFKRYTCDAVMNCNETYRENIRKILSSMQGAISFASGKGIRIHAGKYDVPTITIDNTYLRDGNITYSPSLPRYDLYNSVRGTFIDSEHNFEVTDFPTVENESFVTADGGERLQKDITLNATTDQERAQRLAKIILNRSRFSGTLTLNCNFKAFGIITWDTVKVNLEDFGFVDKVFRVHQFKINDNGDGIDLVLQEEDSSVYDWEADDASLLDPGSILPAPNFNSVQPPSSLTIDEQTYQDSPGAAIKTKLVISFEPSDDAFVSSYQLEYTDFSDGNYTVADNSEANYFELNGIRTGLYNFRVKAINVHGRFSEYISQDYEVRGLQAPPDDISNFSINILHNNAHLSWDISNEADVIQGGKIIIKHTPDTISPSWSNAVEIVPALTGNATQVVAPLLTGTYLIKAVDSYGNESENAQTISAVVPNLVNMNLILTQDEHSGFTGTKTDMIVSDGYLQLDGTYPDHSTSASYVFSNYVDIGKVLTCRVSMSLNFILTGNNPKWDEYTVTWDEITGKWDGDQITGASVKYFIRTTNDDPSGTPTWSSWSRFFVGDFKARAFEAKIEITISDSIYNVLIDELSLNVDVPDLVDSASQVTSDSGPTSITFNKDFYSVPSVLGGILDQNDGERVIIDNVTNTGFTLSVKDATDTLIVKNVYWMARGY